MPNGSWPATTPKPSPGTQNGEAPSDPLAVGLALRSYVVQLAEPSKASRAVGLSDERVEANLLDVKRGKPFRAVTS